MAQRRSFRVFAVGAGSYQKVLMPDPKRHNIVISTSSGTALLAFGDQPGSATEGIRIPSGQLPFKIDRDMVGESIEDSLWINGTAASFITLQVLVES